MHSCFLYVFRWTKSNRRLSSFLQPYHQGRDIPVFAIPTLPCKDQREDYYCGIAEAYIHLGRLDDAEENLQTAIELGPDNPRYWLLMSELLMGQERYEEVLDLLEEAEDNSESIEFAYFHAAELFHLNRKKQALVILESALREGFAEHKRLFEISPAMKNDPDILSIIHYFEGEPTNASIWTNFMFL